MDKIPLWFMVGALVWLLSIANGYVINNSSAMRMTGKHMNESVSFGENVINRWQRLETSLNWAGIKVSQNSPSHGLHIVSGAVADALAPARAALIAARATQHLLNTRCQSLSTGRQLCSRILSGVSLKQTPLKKICTSTLNAPCKIADLKSPFRQFDGSCNQETVRGKALTAYIRLLFPDYQDGVLEPRRSVTKSVLPSPRLVSTKLVGNVDQEDRKTSLAFMQWSQFVAHDLAHTATCKMVSSKLSIECCDKSGFNLSPRHIHPMCMPIPIPSDDPFYSKYRTNCMSYVRSLPAPRPDCTFGPLEQMNQATHFLDGSQIYGSSTAKANALRTFKGGKLLTNLKEGKEFLPEAVKIEDSCQSSQDNDDCYEAGDARVNMQPHLTAMHILWMREHNRLAKRLKTLNPHWDDERLFQEARRIVIAQIQHITYMHWLPILVGKDASRVLQNSEYKEGVDPSVSNEFATVALKFVGSMMTNKLKIVQEDRNSNKSVRLQDYFNNPSIVDLPGYFDGLIRGLATQNSQQIDLQFASDVTQQLYKTNSYGMDSLSLDIQRGRDHGLPPYTSYKEFCGLSIDKESFDSLSTNIPLQIIQHLRQIYSNPKDIDLLVGALAESPKSGSLLGPTFTCLIIEQMERTKTGDRYFYSNSDQSGAFTKEQLEELRKASLSRIFCDNGDGIKKMQPNVFSVPAKGNIVVNCDSEKIPRIDLKKWQEMVNSV